MKKMKNLAVVLVLFCFALFSCDAEEEVSPQPTFSFENRVPFSTTVSMWKQDHQYNDEQSNDLQLTEFSFYGVSKTKNLYNFQMKMNHVANKIEFGNSVKISDGNFEISGENGDMIFGTFEGYGSIAKANQETKYLFIIKGGQGDFYNATGNMSATSQRQNPAVLEFDFKGTIIRSKEEDPSK